jgi:ribosomal-protein-alanine N-acetyltransferase
MTHLSDAVVIEPLSTPDSDDLAAIVTVEAESFANPWTPEALATMLQSHVTQLYVARDPRGIVGFCACWVIDGELHINTLAVARTHRRQGIATRLVRFVLDTTRVERATLEVRRSNAAAINLYEKLGFRTTAVRKGYYRNPDEDGLILWLNP